MKGIDFLFNSVLVDGERTTRDDVCRGRNSFEEIFRRQSSRKKHRRRHGTRNSVSAKRDEHTVSRLLNYQFVLILLNNYKF